jgi:hypothetical protein
LLVFFVDVKDQKQGFSITTVSRKITDAKSSNRKIVTFLTVADVKGFVLLTTNAHDRLLYA